MTIAIGLAALVVALRVGLGLMFAVAGVAKLRRGDRWREAVAAYRLVPHPLLGGVAIVLPIAEIVVASGLLSGVALDLAAIAAAALLLVFAAAIAINLVRGRRELDCGCNPGARPQPIAWPLVARNVVLAGAAIPCTLPMPPLAPEIVAVSAVAGAVAVLLAHVLAMLRSFAPARPALSLSGAR